MGGAGRRSGESRSGRGGRRLAALLGALAVAGLGAAGAYLAVRSEDGGDRWPVARVPVEEYRTEAGDQVEVAAAGQLPSFLAGTSAYTRSAYQFAITHQEELSHIPCYCGCGRMGHMSNLSCYLVRDERDRGRVAWNRHGRYCGMCLDITHDVMRLLAQGRSLAEIRAEIDRKYAPMGDVPTPTPHPGSS